MRPHGFTFCGFNALHFAAHGLPLFKRKKCCYAHLRFILCFLVWASRIFSLQTGKVERKRVYKDIIDQCHIKSRGVFSAQPAHAPD
jgi:hypothetical protein